MGLLDGQIAVITASAGAGIGIATARRFLEEGAQVVITDAHDRRATETGAKLSEEFGRKVPALEVDVTNPEQVNGMVDFAAAEYGRLDILVNNAARNIMSPVKDMTDDVWRTVLDTCLTGTFLGCRAALKPMLAQQSGRIVNLASVAGWGGAANQAHYAAAKAGVMALTRALAMEVARQGIRVNAVAPSYSPNPFLERIYPKEQLERMAAGAALGRGAEPREIANVILFLASDLSSYMTGEVLSCSNQHP
jgi:3-oxoacyl-[acyl-carrier protein] reductase